MPTQPPEILALAGRIRDANPDECGRRSAASRAYYAALLHTEGLLGKAQRRPQGQPDSSHEQIIRAALQRSSSGGAAGAAAANFARELARMRVERNRADYRLQETFSEANCRDMFIRSNSVMRNLLALGDPPPVAEAPAGGGGNAGTSSSPGPGSPPPTGPRPPLKRIQ